MHTNIFRFLFLKSNQHLNYNDKKNINPSKL